MNITSAKFVKGVVAEDEILEDGTPQVAFIGRSNVGKSSLINCLVNRKGHDALFQRVVFPCCRDSRIVNLYGRSTSGGFSLAVAYGHLNGYSRRIVVERVENVEPPEL